MKRKTIREFKDFIGAVCEAYGHAGAIKPLQDGFDAMLEAASALVPVDDWKAEYGDGGINTYEHSADGFFATPREPIGYAILNNDVEWLKKLHEGTFTVEQPWNTDGFSEDLDHDGVFHYDFMRGYSKEFEEDWERVIGTTDNQEALRLMLSYVPEFFVCSADFWNAFRAGYDKKLLYRLLDNYPGKDDKFNNYLPWDNVSIDEVLAFLDDKPAPVTESASGASKRKWISKIYKVAEPLTKGLFRDDNWASVYTLFDTIKKSVPEVEFTVGAKDGGYSNPGEDGMPRRKTYDIAGKTPEGFPIVGQLHCDAAGTMENPFGAYDMTLILN